MKNRESEDRLLLWLRRRLGPGALIGDDAAVLPAGGPWAVTVDSQIAGVHFPPGLDPALLARRLLAVNLSDLAATGARPAYGFLALAATAGFDHRRFFTALLAACETYGLTLAGGDLASHPATVSATLTLIGTLPGGGRFVRRAGAAPGDALWAGGTVGESAAGRLLLAAGARMERARLTLPPQLPAELSPAARRAVRRHLAPSPQLELGLWLGREERASAIDLSDGLALDLFRLCNESSVGAEVIAAELPRPGRFPALCRFLGRDPLDLALGGGEDYVLLFTLPPDRLPPSHLGCRRIGTITRPPHQRLIENGARRPLPRLGWDHLADR